MEIRPFERSPEVELNLKDHVFYHGAKGSADLEKIRKEGFRSEFVDQDGRWFRDGNLGVGIYLSCNWKTALWFGPTLLEVTLLEGTRIFDASVNADRDVLKNLKRRFNAHILDALDFRKEVPVNKSISFREFAELFRYHYHHVWPEVVPGKGDNHEWSVERKQHYQSLKVCIGQLRKFGYHGYGHPADDNGIVIFQPERIVLKGVVIELPVERHGEMLLRDGALERLGLRELASRYGRSLPCAYRRIPDPGLKLPPENY